MAVGSRTGSQLQASLSSFQLRPVAWPQGLTFPPFSPWQVWDGQQWSSRSQLAPSVEKALLPADKRRQPSGKKEGPAPNPKMVLDL